MNVDRTSYFRVIWASKIFLLVFAIAAAAVVYLYSSSQTEEFESTALGQVVSAGQAKGEILNPEQLLSLSNILSQVAETSTVLEIAHEDKAVKGHNEAFDEAISVSPEAQAGLLAFSAKTADPNESAAFANAYADAFETYLRRTDISQRKEELEPVQTRINEVQGELEVTEKNAPSYSGLQIELQSLQEQVAAATSNPGDTLRVVEPAFPVSTPVAPKPERNAILAFIGALLFGIAAVYLRDLFFDRYRSADEAVADLGLPLLGEIPNSRRGPAIESFRSLRTSLLLALAEAPSGRSGKGTEAGAPRIVVTGAESGCGKTYVTSNFARTLAAEARRVVVIDADLRRPKLHEAFNVPLSPGLTDILRSPDPPPVHELITPVHIGPARNSSVGILPAGNFSPAAVERLSSEQMEMAIGELGNEGEMVVLDSPPVGAVVDAVVVARFTEGILFVLDARKTRRRDARRAIASLRATGVPVLGFAWNRSSNTQMSYGAYRPRQTQQEERQPRETRT